MKKKKAKPVPKKRSATKVTKVKAEQRQRTPVKKTKKISSKIKKSIQANKHTKHVIAAIKAGKVPIGDLEIEQFSEKSILKILKSFPIEEDMRYKAADDGSRWVHYIITCPIFWFKDCHVRFIFTEGNLHSIHFYDPSWKPHHWDEKIEIASYESSKREFTKLFGKPNKVWKGQVGQSTSWQFHPLDLFVDWDLRSFSSSIGINIRTKNDKN